MDREEFQQRIGTEMAERLLESLKLKNALLDKIERMQRDTLLEVIKSQNDLTKMILDINKEFEFTYNKLKENPTVDIAEVERKYEKLKQRIGYISLMLEEEKQNILAKKIGA